MPVTTTSAASGSRTWNSYDAYMSLGGEGRARDLVLEQVSTWLREKGHEVDLAHDGGTFSESSDLVVVHHEGRHIHDVLVRLTERTPTGTWRTALLLSDPDEGGGWLRLRVSNDEEKFVDVPRVAAYVMEAVDTFDGPCMFLPTPRIISAAGVDDFIDELCDPERRAPVFAAAALDDVPFGTYVSKVEAWTKQVRGLGHVVVLDPLATEAFSSAVGTSHLAPVGTIRTYLPEVDPASEVDARRHKILGTARLVAQHDRETARLLGRVARDAAARRLLPTDVTRVERALRRNEDSLLLAELEPREADTAVAGVQVQAEIDATVEVVPAETAPSVDLAAQAAEYLTQIELMKSALGLDVITAENVRALSALVERGRSGAATADLIASRLKGYEDQVEQLQFDVELYKELYEEEEFERALADDARSDLEDEVRWLRRQLREQGAYDAAVAGLPDDERTRFPRDFVELHGRLTELEPMVVFTGDVKVLLELDDVDSMSKVVRGAWESLLVLHDYVVSRLDGRVSGGIEQYLDAVPEGCRAVPKTRFATTETGRTMRDHGDERVFPVPTSVDPSGSDTMKPHFKLGRVGMVSPRMYVLDRVAQDSVVYVGYIGPHLTNSQTN